ncbi:MAG: glycosyl hydrolase family 8 [Fibrobacterota bacterium]
MSFMKKSIVFLTLVSFGYGSAPLRPFPQNIDFEGLIKPSGYTQEELNDHVAGVYEHYKTFLQESLETENGYYMLSGGTNIGFDTTATVSEAHGYGMLVFALMAGYEERAKEYFDGMYYFYKDNPSSINSYNMAWEIEGYEQPYEDRSSATDGDMDIAYALILAHRQWGSDGEINYLQEAQDMIEYGLKNGDMSTETARTMLGDWDGDAYTTRSSDWMTAHMRAYHWATDDPFWLEAADTVYSIVDAVTRNYSPETGLMPDFVAGADPYPDSEGGGTGENNAEYYDWNACRYPWRIATDYAHFGTPEAKEAVSKILDWLIPATNGDPSAMVAGYSLDGAALTDRVSIGFQAPAGLAATVDKKYQEYLDASWEVMRESTWSGVYVTAINLLSMMVVSGNWWNPVEDDDDDREFSLHVSKGSGGGTYEAGTEVTIAADQAPAGYVFKKWAGDTDALAAPADSVATVKMPDQDVFVTAFYTDPDMEIDTAGLSDNFIHMAEWGEDADEVGSSVEYDPGDDSLGITLDLLEESGGGYSWIKAVATVAGWYDEVDYILIRYSASRDVSFVLEQTELFDNGASHYHWLPAAEDTTVLLHIDDFEQPDWTPDHQWMDTPDMSDVFSVAFNAVGKGRTTDLTVYDLRLNYFSPKVTDVICGDDYAARQSMDIQTALDGTALMVHPPQNKTAGVVGIYDMNGRRVLHNSIEGPGQNTPVMINLEGITPGTYIVNLRYPDATLSRRIRVR